MNPPPQPCKTAVQTRSEHASSAQTSLILQLVDGNEVVGNNFMENFLYLMNIFYVLSVQSAELTLNSPLRVLLCNLSNWAFSALNGKFQEIISPPRFLPAASPRPLLYNREPCLLQDFCTHLRSCVALLYMLDFDYNLMMEKSQILVNMLKTLCCPDEGPSSFSSQALGNKLWSFALSNLASHRNIDEQLSGLNCEENGMDPSVPAVLSVVEVMADELLVHHSLRMHVAELYHSHSSFVGETIILELLSSHYILSCCSGPHSIGQLFRSSVELTSQRLSLSTAVALLGMAEVNSAPPMLLAHIILLVSRSVINSRNEDLAAVDCCLAAFERAAIWLASPGQTVGGAGFDLCVRRSTRDLVNSHRPTWAEESLSHQKLPHSVSACEAYLSENLGMMAAPRREEARAILDAVLCRIGTGQRDDIDGVDFPLTDEATWMAAAMLRLMGSALFRIAAAGGLKDSALKSVRSVAGQVFPTCGMLVHLSRWLVRGAVNGSRPVWEGCIWAMLAILNLDLEAQVSLSRPPTELRESSMAIAAKLRKMQELYLKGGLDWLAYEPSRHGGAEFLRWVAKEEDWEDELVDFIDAKPGKDYGQWLKSRLRYNQWKRSKSSAISKARKLALWKKLAR
ncbi:2-isopropylmalate synthase [Wolffia australiana]